MPDPALENRGVGSSILCLVPLQFHVELAVGREPATCCLRNSCGALLRLPPGVTFPANTKKKERNVSPCFHQSPRAWLHPGLHFLGVVIIRRTCCLQKRSSGPPRRVAPYRAVSFSRAGRCFLTSLSLLACRRLSPTVIRMGVNLGVAQGWLREPGPFSMRRPRDPARRRHPARWAHAGRARLHRPGYCRQRGTTVCACPPGGRGVTSDARPAL